jgi:hypothetical protein
MSTMNRVALAFDEEREELIIRLAEMAGILRAARREGAAVPVVCLLDCSARHWTAWGRGTVCCNCGTPAVAADTWHRWLTEALRTAAQLAPAERRAA